MEDFVRVVVGSIRPFYANLDDALEAERDGKVVILYEGDGIREAREGRAMAASDIQSRLAQNAWKRYMYEALCPPPNTNANDLDQYREARARWWCPPKQDRDMPAKRRKIFIDID